MAKRLNAEGEPVDEDPQLETGGTLLQTEAMDSPSNLTRAGHVIGTLEYMPPEQAQGKWELVDERADVFALGAILCELLIGRTRYLGKDVYERLRRAECGDLVDTLASLKECRADAALTELCFQCLSVERQQRPQHAGEVALRVAEYQTMVQKRLRC